MREHNDAVNRLDFITTRAPITADYAPGELVEVTQHDGSVLRLRKLHADYDPTNRVKAMDYVQSHQAKGELVTGPLYVDSAPEDLHVHHNTVEVPFNTLGEKQLCPGSAKKNGGPKAAAVLDCEPGRDQCARMVLRRARARPARLSPSSAIEPGSGTFVVIS